jgi:predicted aspartyl protease
MKTDIHINGKSLSFKLDTGAEVTALSGEDIEQLGHVSLQKPKEILCGPDRKP